MTKTALEPSLGRKVAAFAADIKIAHTVFAMPFALLATVMAWKEVGGPILGKLGLILLCMVTARTVAMSANRLLDAELDARNPRTQGRAIPSGTLSRSFYSLAVALCSIAFILGSAAFLYYGNVWPVALSVPVLVFISIYPLLKRLTRWCHYYLGAALGLAPICAYIAVAGGIRPAIIAMGLAVLLWTAGFDIIYACQDYSSDLETGTFSVPSRLGIGRALWISRLTHAVSAVLLVLVGWLAPQLGLLYFIGASAAIVLLIVEHNLVHPNDLSKAGLAFFAMNGILSLLVGALGVVDVLMH